MTYIPEINHYVKWKNNIANIAGWVYFKSSEYITIELLVRPKTEENYEACVIHANDRLLILCYHDQWKELEYVKSRESIYEDT